MKPVELSMLMRTNYFKIVGHLLLLNITLQTKEAENIPDAVTTDRATSDDKIMLKIYSSMCY